MLKASEKLTCPHCGHILTDIQSGVPGELLVKPVHEEFQVHDGGNLPHWQVEVGTYFLTWRLADSIPRDVASKLESERNQLLAQARGNGVKVTSRNRSKILAPVNKRIEAILDNGHGSCVLREQEVSSIVINALRFFEGKRYRLFAWCVMPNHVHVVAKLMGGVELSRVMHSWKSFSAKEINRIIGRSGKLWQSEYFDRSIRNEEHFGRAINYVERNPVKAGLDGWEWVWVHPMFSE